MNNLNVTYNDHFSFSASSKNVCLDVNLNEEIDIRFSGLLGGECNTWFSISHLKTGELFFHRDQDPFYSESYLVLNDGSIYQLLFDRGILLSVFNMNKKCNYNPLVMPKAESIDFYNIDKSDRNHIIFSKDNRKILEITSLDFCFKFDIMSGDKIIEFCCIPSEYILSLDLDNEDGSLDIGTFNYTFDSSFSWCQPVDKSGETICEVQLIDKIKPLLKDVVFYSVEDIKELIKVL